LLPDQDGGPDRDGVPGDRDGGLHLDGVPGARLLALVEIMDTLRVSCPWDQEQTHASLRRYLIEEAYEAVDEIEAGDFAALREELGDVLLQVLFHARIASERPAADGGFTIDDVADTLAAKLIRRHPHVFGSVSVSSAADVNANWEQIKQAERAAKAAAAAAAGAAGGGDTADGGDADGAGAAAVAGAGPSVLDGVPFGQPALSLAAQLLRRAERAGLSGPAGGAEDADGADGPDSQPRPSGSAGERIGAELMALVARAQAAGVDPEMELRAAARRFADEVRERERRR
jgi:XTP/dITP diphosphohydrolase